MPRRREEQLALPIRTWGGARRGAGRPPNGARAGVSHLVRPNHSAAHPVHVTLRTADGVPNLRGRRTFDAVVEALRAGCERPDSRVVHFSVQSNHVHLIAEAKDGVALSGLIQGLSIRIARSVNRATSRTGRVFGDRYHSRALGTPLEVHRALGYVLCNFQKHSAPSDRRLVGFMDGCSSAPWFDGWKIPDATERALGLHRSILGDPPVASPRTWLLRSGYRKHGLVDPNRAPRRR